ncbi:MAG: NADH-quinone oxidoreductase subunit J [Acidimicrobiia bacterium]|nr:NADH-quinone oxidoreductase subunit J [Acidimicrobiia bacterium]
MTFGDWISEPGNVVFLAIGLVMAAASTWVVLTKNVVHAALSLVVTLAGSAALFLLLGAEFVAWTVVLVYIGAVIVLFLFGIMITRAPIGRDSAELDHRRRWPAALVALSIFATMAYATTSLYGWSEEIHLDAPVRTDSIGEILFSRFVIPFEAVSFVLLAALIGGIVLARKDETPQ